MITIADQLSDALAHGDYESARRLALIAKPAMEACDEAWNEVVALNLRGDNEGSAHAHGRAYGLCDILGDQERLRWDLETVEIALGG